MRQRQSFFSISVLLAATVASAQENAPAFAEWGAIAPALPVAVNEAHGRLIVGLSNAGVAWADPRETDKLTLREDWPTLDALELDGDRVLLAGRDGVFRVVEFAGSELELVYQWKGESMSPGVDLRGDVLLVAGGGGGMQLWEWPDRGQPPHLRGRYPFVMFARDIEFLSSQVAIAADTSKAGAWLLDVSDPLRPHSIEHYRARSYCDSADARGEWLAYTDRVIGTHLLHKEPGMEEPERFFLPMLPEGGESNQVQEVIFVGDDLMVSEKNVGLRFLEPDGSSVWRETGRLRIEGGVLDVEVLDDGSAFAIGLLTHEVFIQPDSAVVPLPGKESLEPVP